MHAVSDLNGWYFIVAYGNSPASCSVSLPILVHILILRSHLLCGCGFRGRCSGFPWRCSYSSTSRSSGHRSSGSSSSSRCHGNSQASRWQPPITVILHYL